MPTTRFLFLGLAGLAGLATACATGSTTDGDGGGGDGFGGSGGVVDPTTSSSSVSSSSSGGLGGMGGEGGGMGGEGGGFGGSGGMPPLCDYTPLHTCETAATLQPVSGDEGSDMATVTGDTSDWFEVDIQETDGGLFESDMSYTVTLTHPPSMDYDLVVHEGPEGSGPNCNASPMMGVESGNTETVSHSWDDSQPIGGEDDSRWLSIEVLHVSGSDCGPGFTWTMTVAGNT